MHKGSIKSRLVLIILVCVFGMVVLAGNQIYNTNRLIVLHDQNTLLMQLNSELLQLRRHEKDFLLRKDTKYVDQFKIRAEGFTQKVDALKTFFSQYELEQGKFVSLFESFRIYQGKFLNLVFVHKQIGLDENKGFQKQFRNATHALEAEFERNSQADLQVNLLQLRRNEKDFMLRKDMRYVEQEISLYEKLHMSLIRSNVPNQQSLRDLLEEYQSSFIQLVRANQEVGLDHEDGLQGAFRKQAHSVEAELGMLDSKLAGLIVNAERKVKRNSLLIMTATCITLIVLLIRSFITFQKAFANFVMFFYRCKREYQHIDEKKQGFSEFKYLATIANEMIDARREIELELKEAKEQIEAMNEEKEKLIYGSSPS